MNSITIWHNTVGRPIEYPATDWCKAWTYAGRSGISGSGIDDREFVRTIETYGHAIVENNRCRRPMNHRMIGTGVGHSDADWCESRFLEGSMAVYYENGEDFRGERWWDEGAQARKYYMPEEATR
jgi:hypothetical protein